MKNNLLIILVLITVIPSCKKSVLETRTNNLTNGSWRLTAHVYSNAFGTTNVYAVLPDCRKDDYRRFNKDGTCEINEGPTTCNAADPQTKIIQWNFTTNNTNKIEIDGRIYRIYTLNENTFEIETYNPDPYADHTTFTYSR